MVDDFCHSHRPKRQPGPEPSLSESEIITLAIFARWSRFSHELEGLRSRLAGRVALHNFCMWLNKQLGRPCYLSLACWDGDLKTHTKRSRGW
jgi:hypothetical protein